jgi:hypothetical protein
MYANFIPISTSEKPADFEIYEVTIDVSLSMGMSSTTESIAPLNLGINLRKYEYPAKSRT